MLTAVEETARQAIGAVEAIRTALFEVKHVVREKFKFYSQDLINHLFAHPYTKVQFVMSELGVSRITATRYLDELANAGVLHKLKAGRSNFYINTRLYDILTKS